MASAPSDRLDALRARGPGLVVAPGEPDWDAARAAFNLAVDQRPEAVAFPESVADVVAVVESARGSGLSSPTDFRPPGK